MRETKEPESNHALANQFDAIVRCAGAPEIIYINKRDQDIDTGEVEDLNQSMWEIAEYPPDYNGSLWDNFVIITVKGGD